MRHLRAQLPRYRTGCCFCQHHRLESPSFCGLPSAWAAVSSRPSTSAFWSPCARKARAPLESKRQQRPTPVASWLAQCACGAGLLGLGLLPPFPPAPRVVRRRGAHAARTKRRREAAGAAAAAALARRSHMGHANHRLLLLLGIWSCVWRIRCDWSRTGAELPPPARSK